MTTEIDNSKAAQIERLEKLGSIHPDCATCKRDFYNAPDPVDSLQFRGVLKNPIAAFAPASRARHAAY